MFEIGDYVMVRENLETGRYYGNWMFPQAMGKYRGQIFKVIDSRADAVYALEGCNDMPGCNEGLPGNHWGFTNEMLISVNLNININEFEKMLLE